MIGKGFQLSYIINISLQPITVQLCEYYERLNDKKNTIKKNLVLSFLNFIRKYM